MFFFFFLTRFFTRSYVQNHSQVRHCIILPRLHLSIRLFSAPTNRTLRSPILFNQLAGLTQTAFRRACITFFDLALTLQECICTYDNALIHVHWPLSSRFSIALLVAIGIIGRQHIQLAWAVQLSQFVKANQMVCRISRYRTICKFPLHLCGTCLTRIKLKKIIIYFSIFNCLNNHAGAWVHIIF